MNQGQFGTESVTLNSAEEMRIRAAYARRRAVREARSDDACKYSMFDPAHLLAIQSVERRLVVQLARHNLAKLHDRKILEIGCGGGGWLAEFIRLGARPENLAGVDLIEEQLAGARRILPSTVQLHCGSAADLPFADASSDLVAHFTLFSSILDDYLKRAVAKEMQRVLRPGGAIIWFDFRINNPHNPDVRGVGRSEIRRLFPDFEIDLQSVVLAPPIARRLASMSKAACRLLETIPVLRTHYMGVLKRAAD